MRPGSISSRGPSAVIRPAAMTTILSAISSIRSWCEMMMSVLVFDKRPIVSQISRSLCGSTLEVASSKIIYCASESSALAIPIFWRCPPESAAPAFPTSESSPFGSVFKKLPSPASDNASFNFSSFAFGSASNIRYCSRLSSRLPSSTYRDAL